MNAITMFLITFLLATASLSAATRSEPSGSAQTQTKAKGHHSNKGPGSGSEGGMGGFYGPWGGFNIPGFGSGWGNGMVGGGYGSGYGGPSGGYSKAGIIRPSVVCKEQGPCYKKKLTCPAKCFSSYSRSGKNYGAGGGGGGCTIDCKKSCTAYC